MPISLRLPLHIEAQNAGYDVRQGMIKLAVTAKSIQEFLAKHAERSARATQGLSAEPTC